MKYGDKKIKDLFHKINKSSHSQTDIKRIGTRIERARLAQELRRAIKSENYDQLTNNHSMKEYGYWSDGPSNNWDLWKKVYLGRTKNLPTEDRASHFKSLFKRYSPIIARTHNYNYVDLTNICTLRKKFIHILYEWRKRPLNHSVINPLTHYLLTKIEDSKFWNTVFANMKHEDSLEPAPNKSGGLRWYKVKPYSFSPIYVFDKESIITWIDYVIKAYNTKKYVTLQEPIRYFDFDSGFPWKFLTKYQNTEYHPEWIQSLITYLLTRQDFIDFIEAYEVKHPA